MRDLLPALLVTAFPAVFLFAVAVAFQPRPLRPARHRTGVRAPRIVRREEAARERLQRGRPRPIGWQSPPWTVEVTTR